MPVINRSGYRLKVKRHPLWIRIVLFPDLESPVVVGESAVAGEDVRRFDVASWSFDPRISTEPLPNVRRIGEDDLLRMECDLGTFDVVPLEYLTSVYTGYKLTNVAASDLASIQGDSKCYAFQQHPCSLHMPVLHLRFTNETGGVIEKHVYAKKGSGV